MLPPGAVLVVGSAQSGTQIAEELSGKSLLASANIKRRRGRELTISAPLLRRLAIGDEARRKPERLTAALGLRRA
jgi:cation diffusion facilitator CzcD-associated flavoprotein CzcO